MRYHCMEGMGIISSLIKLSSHLQDAPHLSYLLQGETVLYRAGIAGPPKI